MTTNKLITKEIDAKLCNPDGRPHLKLFAPWGAATWLVSERDDDELFGLADMGFECPEMGYFSLFEIENLTGPFGLKIERDLHFQPTMNLEEYADQARANGRIMA